MWWTIYRFSFKEISLLYRILGILICIIIQIFVRVLIKWYSCMLLLRKTEAKQTLLLGHIANTRMFCQLMFWIKMSTGGCIAQMENVAPCVARRVPKLMEESVVKNLWQCTDNPFENVCRTHQNVERSIHPYTPNNPHCYLFVGSRARGVTAETDFFC